MSRYIFSLILLVAGSGCCCCCPPRHACQTGPKPPLNCLGNSYDGASSGCYRPPGPFWCCLPGPCSTCRDPWLQFYQERNAGWIGRPVCAVGESATTMDDDEFMMTQAEVPAPRVIHQAKAED